MMMNAPPCRVQFYIPDLYDVRYRHFARAGTSAPQDRSDSRHQLARIERLRQIIVGTNLESYNSVHIFAARGQQQDRDTRSVTKSPKNIKAVQRWKHDVEDY